MRLPNWLQKIVKFIQNFFSHIPAELQAAIHTGVTVTENIKTFVDSPAADILTALIPGNLDDKIKTALRQALPTLLTQLKLADNCAGAQTSDEIVTCATQTLQALDGNIKNAFLHSLAVMIAQVAADGQLTWQDTACVVEWYYQQRFKAQDVQ
ncbi:hypothetical protein HH214_04385 [Mucilaginibacter robiniae]|uniref:Uncharacterized protein n=1 Tax=Mucilaginibacter robiniae TaxID=2728022 RepID=A0A7L5DWP3_9SPHI|nr:hypothetical protein [Mucilaginibacter robiniae]QJD95171.1 hypothetical protein HH214_04385 [Mucilaginibacter robiniae]